MNTHIKLSVVSSAVMVALYAAPVQADQLKDLVDKGMIGVALQLAQSQQADRAGDPEFDLPYAKALLANGNADEAEFVIERVLILEPGNVEARLVMAEVLTRQGRRAEAAYVLSQIEASNAGQADQRQALSLQLGPQKAQSPQAPGSLQTRVTGFVDFAIGYDDNFNFGPDSRDIEIAGGQRLTLSDGFREQSTSYANLKGYVSAFKPLDSNSGLTASAYVDNTSNISEPLDRTLYRVGGGYVTQVKADRFSVTVDYEINESDRDKFRDGVGVTAQLTGPANLMPGTGWGSSIVLGYRDLNYDNSTRDADRYLAAYQLSKDWGPYKHTVSTYFILDDAKQNLPGVEKEYFGVSYGISHLDGYLLGGVKVKPYASLSFTHLVEDGVRDNLPRERHDEIYGLKLGMNWKQTDQLTWRAEYSFSEGSSNLDLYDISRQTFEIGLRFQFN